MRIRKALDCLLEILLLFIIVSCHGERKEEFQCLGVLEPRAFIFSRMVF